MVRQWTARKLRPTSRALPLHPAPHLCSVHMAWRYAALTSRSWRLSDLLHCCDWHWGQAEHVDCSEGAGYTHLLPGRVIWNLRRGLTQKGLRVSAFDGFFNNKWVAFSRSIQSDEHSTRDDRILNFFNRKKMAKECPLLPLNCHLL